MAILLNNDGHWHDKWQAALAKHMPNRTVHEFPDIPEPDTIDYALIWKHPDGDLKRYSNLKAVFSLGSGVDHLDANKNLPDVPIFRLIDINMADDMALYTLYWTIHFQRQLGRYAAQQNRAHWQRYPTPLAPDYKICVLGLGAIGSHIAQVLAKNGFAVSGWSRSPKDIAGINCVSGAADLEDILEQVDVMVCCLPLNRATHHYIDETILSQLKRGGHLINISRGAVINDGALLKLLRTGHIAGAALDVFETEPLPKTSPYWAHPNVHITPHMSGATNPDTAAQIIAKDIAGFEKGVMPKYIYQREPL